MRTQNLLSLIIVMILFIIAIYIYPYMPEQMPIHWNAEGEVDNYGHKAFALFIMPSVALFMFLLMLAIPKMAVHKKNIKEIEPKLSTFILLFIMFFTILYFVMIHASLGVKVNVSRYVLIFIALIFFYTSYLIKDIKKNFFIGIRTPWTLSSENVWKKTHKLGSRMFIKFGIFFIIGAFLPAPYNVGVVLAPLIIGIFILVLYSYLEFKKELKKKKK